MTPDTTTAHITQQSIDVQIKPAEAMNMLTAEITRLKEQIDRFEKLTGVDNYDYCIISLTDLDHLKKQRVTLRKHLVNAVFLLTKYKPKHHWLPRFKEAISENGGGE